MAPSLLPDAGYGLFAKREFQVGYIFFIYLRFINSNEVDKLRNTVVCCIASSPHILHDDPLSFPISVNLVLSKSPLTIQFISQHQTIIKE